jgi:outer membrane protein assembly factor BamB
MPVLVSGRQSRWLRGRRFIVENSWDGLACIRADDGVREWTTPLPDSPGYSGEPMSVAEAEGSILVLWHRGMIHALSPVDRRTLWSRPMPPRFSRPIEFAWTLDQSHTAPAMTTRELADQVRQQSAFARQGPEIAVSNRVAVVLGQREMVAFDLLSGAELWRRTGLDSAGDLLIDGDAVCISRSSGSGAPLALRLADGSELPAGELARNFAKSIAVSGSRLFIADSPFRLFQKVSRIAMVRPRTGEPVWQHEFPAETRFSFGHVSELIAIDPEGRISTIDLGEGTRSEIGTLPPKVLREHVQLAILGDHERVYVATSFHSGERISYFSIPSVRVNGEVYAFARDGKSNWRHSGKGLFLVVSQFDRLPAVILGEFQTEERKVANNELFFLQSVEIVALDKSTGRELVRWSGATTGNCPSFLTIDPANRWVDLLSYNERLRLQHSPAPTAASAPQ